MNLYRLIDKLLLIIFFIFFQISVSFAKSSIDSNYVFFPKPFIGGSMQSSFGISITRLPIQIVEEEINYSPTLNFDTRFDVSKYFSIRGALITNYITNQLSVGPFYNHFFNNFSFSIGFYTSGWYSHLNIDEIKLNTYGITLSPKISIGYALHKLLTTIQFESQHNFFWNYLEKEYLGFTKILDGGFSINLITEQPFTDKINLAIALKLNYNKFNNQSWLAYSILDEYLFYPEFYLGILF